MASLETYQQSRIAGNSTRCGVLSASLAARAGRRSNPRRTPPRRAATTSRSSPPLVPTPLPVCAGGVFAFGNSDSRVIAESDATDRSPHYRTRRHRSNHRNFRARQIRTHFGRNPRRRNLCLQKRHSEPSPIHFTACGSRSPDWRPPPHPAAGHRSAFPRERTSWCGRSKRRSPRN